MKRLVLIGTLVWAAVPAVAQYKVVGPDGRITYTDRPPAAAGQVSTMRRDGSIVAPAAASPLPLELRAVAARFPVVLYTAPECEPCDNARRLLKQRGIPLAERQVMNSEDLVVVERQTGGRTLPVLTVGAQALHGYSENRWGEVLDLAGYPRESKLPRDYVAAAPQPITPPARPAPPAPEPTPAPRPERPPADVAETPPPPSIRF